MNLTGDPISAEMAEHFGLVNRLVPDHELFDTALAWARKLAGQAPLAIEQIKQVSAAGDLDAGIEAEKRGFATAFASEDAHEGISAFLRQAHAEVHGQVTWNRGTAPERVEGERRGAVPLRVSLARNSGDGAAMQRRVRAELLMSAEIDELAELIRGADRVVALTGAGISVPSGIPDFRSPRTGLWENVDPMEVAHIDVFRRDPERFWQFYGERFAALEDKRPNGAHHALVALERAGLLHGGHHAEHRSPPRRRRHPRARRGPRDDRPLLLPALRLALRPGRGTRAPGLERGRDPAL